VDLHVTKRCVIFKVGRFELMSDFSGYNPNKGKFIWNRECDGLKHYEIGGKKWMIRVMWVHNKLWPFNTEWAEGTYICNCRLPFKGKLTRDLHFVNCYTNPNRVKK